MKKQGDQPLQIITDEKAWRVFLEKFDAFRALPDTKTSLISKVSARDLEQMLSANRNKNGFYLLPPNSPGKDQSQNSGMLLMDSIYKVRG